jgi:hypothetical protein
MTTYLCVEYLSFSFGLDTPVMSETYTTQYTANNMHTRQIVIPKKIIKTSQGNPWVFSPWEELRPDSFFWLKTIAKIKYMRYICNFF